MTNQKALRNQTEEPIVVYLEDEDIVSHVVRAVLLDFCNDNKGVDSKQN